MFGSSRRVAVVVVLALLAAFSTLTYPAGAGPVDPPPVDPSRIAELPVRGQWGVTDQDPAALHDFENLVWDFAELGGRIYVAGSFLHVKRWKHGTAFDQPYLAAFDLATGAWIAEFSPRLDGPVFALEVSPLGSLIAGGQFGSADGLADAAGIVALDPVSGRVDTRFRASVQRPWADELPVVRALEVDGNRLYLAGNFSHVRGNSDRQRMRAAKVARVDARWGTPDGTWRPIVNGAGVYGMAVDTARARVHLAGFFSSVGGAPDTGSFATVDTTSGAVVTGLARLEENLVRAAPRKLWDVALGGAVIVTAGEEHIAQVLDATTRRRLGHHATGLACDTFEFFGCDRGGFTAGGDFQVAERIGDWIWVGCHCTYETRGGRNQWYDSFARTRRPVKLAGAIDTRSGRASSWSPDLAGSRQGVWAVHSDSRGCLLLGGQFDVAGVETGSAFWVGNWARFCPPGV